MQLLGKSLTWTPIPTQRNDTRQLVVSVRPRSGKTLIRIEERNANLAAGMFIGIGVGFGVGAGLPTSLGIGGATGSPLLAFGLLAVILLLSFLVARTLYITIARRRARAGADLLARLRAVLRSAGAGPSAEEPAANTAKRVRIRDAERLSAEFEAEAEAEAEGLEEAEKNKARQGDD